VPSRGGCHHARRQNTKWEARELVLRPAIEFCVSTRTMAVRDGFGSTHLDCGGQARGATSHDGFVRDASVYCNCDYRGIVPGPRVEGACQNPTSRSGGDDVSRNQDVVVATTERSKRVRGLLIRWMDAESKQTLPKDLVATPRLQWHHSCGYPLAHGLHVRSLANS